MSDPLPLPEPDYYAASDSDIRPRLIHRRAEVERHLKELEKDGGLPVPWEGNVWGLYAERSVRRIVAACVAAERERAALVAESWATEETSTTCANVAAAIRALPDEHAKEPK